MLNKIIINFFYILVLVTISSSSMAANEEREEKRGNWHSVSSARYAHSNSSSYRQGGSLCHRLAAIFSIISISLSSGVKGTVIRSADLECSPSIEIGKLITLTPKPDAWKVFELNERCYPETRAVYEGGILCSREIICTDTAKYQAKTTCPTSDFDARSIRLD